MKPIQQTTAVAVAGLTALTGVSTTHADAITVPAPEAVVEATTVATSTEIPSSAEIKPQVDEASQAVETAQANVESAQSAVEAQESVIATAEQEVANANESVTQAESAVAKAEETSAQATPENIERAEQAVETAQENVDSAQFAIPTAESAENQATQAVEVQEGVLGTANEAVSSAQTAVETAKTAVATSETALDPQAQAQAEKTVAEIKTAISADEKAVAEAKTNYDNAVKANSDSESQAKLLADAVKKAEENLNTAVSDATKAGTYLVALRGELSDATDALNKAKTGETVTKTETTYEEVVEGGSVTANSNVLVPKFDPKLVELVKQLNEGKITFDKFVTVWKHRSGEDLVSIPEGLVFQNDTKDDYALKGQEVTQFYKVEDSDKTLYNVDNLPKDVLVDTLMYATAFINSIRTQLGETPLVVTQDSIDTAIGLTDAYLSSRPYNLSRTGWGNTKVSHDSYERGIYNESLIKVVPEGSEVLVVESNRNGVISEYHKNLNFTAITRADLKYRVVRAILRGFDSFAANRYTSTGYDNIMNYASLFFMGGGSDSNSALGLDVVRFAGGTPIRSEYGTFFFTRTSAKGEALANPYETVTGGTTTRKPITKEVTEVVVNPTEVAEAQRNYDTKALLVTTAEQAVKDAEQAVKTAEAVLAKTQEALKTGNTGVSLVEPARKALADAEAKLAYDKARLTKAEQLLDSLKGDKTAKEQALTTAKAELDKATKALESAKTYANVEQAELDRLKAVRATAQQAVTTAKSALATAQTELETAKDTLASLKSAKTTVETAKKALETALSARDAKSAIVDAEKAKLPALTDALATTKGILTEALAVYTPLKAEYDRRVELEKLAEDHVVTILSDGTVVAVPKVTPTEDVKPTIAPAKLAGVTQAIGSSDPVRHSHQPTYSRVARNATLPNTGERGSLFGFLGVSLLAVLGYTGQRRKTN